MTPVKSKKEARLEKKKNKIVALAELVKLNDQDRFKQLKSISANNSYPPDGKMTETTKFEMADNEEPVTKRKRTENSIDLFEQSSKEKSSNQLLNEYDIIKQKKKELKERNCMYHVPKLRLSAFGEKASLEINHENRTPLFLTDIQNLLMTALIGSTTPFTPNRWCIVDKPGKISHTVVIVIDGISLHQYLCHESLFARTTQLLNLRLEILRPALKDYSLLYELAQVPLTNSQRQELTEKFGSLEIAHRMNKDPALMTSTIFCVEKSNNENTHNILVSGSENVIPRTKLLLSALQMVAEGIPLPLRGELAVKFKDYVFTKDIYKPVTDQSPMFSVDCEMCQTTGITSELTRISIVNEKLETVYESLVRPRNQIVNYLTRFSGITPEMMLTVTKTLQEVQTELKEILPPDAILIGHSISADLNAMKMMHPYVIDTSVIYNMSGKRSVKTKLSTLSEIYLNELIQTNADGHDSVEDSIASMKLVQLKIKEGIEFGDEVLQNGKLSERNNEKLVNNMFAHTNESSAIVSSKPIDETFKNVITGLNDSAIDVHKNAINFFESKKNSEAIKKTQEILLDHKLTIVNLNFDSEQLQLARIEKTLKKIEKSVTEIWNSLPYNGMLLALFGGTGEAPNGAVLLNIKIDISKREKSMTPEL